MVTLKAHILPHHDLQPPGCRGSCVELEGQSGTTVAFSGIAAAEPLRFIWEVPGGGRLIPPLKVQRNEVIVNYR